MEGASAKAGAFFRAQRGIFTKEFEMKRKKPGTLKTEHQSNKQQSIDKIESLLKSLKTGMMTTLAGKELHSRPMMYQEFDKKAHELWFFTGKTTGKAHEIENDSRVNISFSNFDSNSYLSIYGEAEIVDDKAKEKELWNPLLKAWFPEGLEDPNLVLIRVRMQSAEYWDSNSSALVQLVGFAKAILTGKPYEASPSENQRVSLN